MEELIFDLPKEKRQLPLFPMGGSDAAGNRYDADGKSLVLNGKRILPVMGEMHYSRVPKAEWRREILKMRAGGVDILATYVFWNHHEERPGEWDFTGSRDLRAFLHICKELDQKVFLRIGPWAHGECRHGGFPDDVQHAAYKTRTDDPEYLERVKALFAKIAEQAEGMMAKDGGPVIGIQLENEYGHCGGPADREEQKRHMKTLYRMAREAGFIAPYYTATAWGGACTIDETLQVLAGYVDAPWDDSTGPLPAMDNYLFTPYHDDADTGSDFGRADASRGTVRRDMPYLTAELGGGLQPTSHRRPVASAKDNAAHILTALGSGAKLIGYYMYHGGLNPDGKYSTLNEAQEIGGNTTVPVKSYDFDACIGEAGRPSESFGALKKYHNFLHAFGEALAECETVLPAVLPENAEDTHTLRAALQWDPEKKSGFLFVNNYVRHRAMDPHADVTLVLRLPEGGELRFPGLDFESGGTYLIPVCMKEAGKTVPLQAVSLLGKLGRRLFFYAGGTSDRAGAEALLEKSGIPATVLTEDEADRSFFFDDAVYLVPGRGDILVEEPGPEGKIRRLLTEQGGPLVKITEDGVRETFAFILPAEKTAPFCKLLHTEQDADGKILYRDHRILLPAAHTGADVLYLKTLYDGDRAEVYLNGKLAADWFTNGKPWYLNLSRYGLPEELILRVYDSKNTIPCRFGQDVYYDLPVTPGCGIRELSYTAAYALQV
ncbi:MAG: beta-galactosidase [Lachnospiraceae bacterium]|nr:beta-galactosidase [Lachnospiraceae bacterium]